MNSKGKMMNFLETESCIKVMVNSLDHLLSKWRYWACSSELVFELISLRTYFNCWLQWNNGKSFGKVKNFEPNHLFDIRDALQRDGDNEGLLLETIQKLKPKIKADCLNFLYSPFLGQFDNHMLLLFVRDISATLGGLLDWKAVVMIYDVKAQIESLKDNLDLFCEVFQWCWYAEEFIKNFKIHFQVLAWRAALLSLLNWSMDVKEEENMGPRMAVILSDLNKETTPKVAWIYHFFKPKYGIVSSPSTEFQITITSSATINSNDEQGDLRDLFNTELNMENIVEALNRQLSKQSPFPSYELVLELLSLRTYFYCWLEWNNRSFGKVKNFELDHLFDIWKVLKRNTRCYHDQLLETIQQLKPKIKQDCLNLDFLDCPSPRNFDTYRFSKFTRDITATLGGLLDWKANAISDVKVQIQSLKDNLDFFCEVFEFAKDYGCHSEEFEKFKIYFQDLAWRAACLSLLYWVLDVKKENMAPRMTVILSYLHTKSSPFADPVVTRMYLAVLTASKPPPQIRLTVGKVVHKFIGFLKDNMQVDPEQHVIQMLFIEFIFLITFLMDRRQVEKLPEGESILTQVGDLVNEVLPLITSINSGEIKVGIGKDGDFIFHNFLEKTNATTVEVRKIYIQLFPYSSSFNFPTINVNVLRRIDSLLENLKGFSFHFPRLPIMMLQEELLSLKESNFEYFSIMSLENKHREINGLSAQIVKMVHNAERAANSFIHMKFLWHDILHFFDVVEEVKLIKREMERIGDPLIYDIQTSNYEKSPEKLLPLQATNISTADELVGFNDELKEILDRLVRGPQELNIVSIVGMPGSGKTTLATVVYASAKYHFHQHAWCTVSQTFDSERMLLDILKCLGVCDNDLSHDKEEDLAHRVRKSLIGRRYLIVMDDIWDIRAWNVLKSSFPDDNMGSRIIFTSRIHYLVLAAKEDCVPFPLKPLTEKESWELLEKTLFGKDNSCPTDFAEIGKQIVIKCKGLPLSVILVAGLLKKNIEDPDWWKQVGERLNSLSAKVDCKAILELSYKHLPKFLKSCFVYFGLFSPDEDIRVDTLILLWISEGFIEKQESKSLEVVAEEYLMDLVGRSLVVATQISSTGRIKACRVHDLLHEFCLRKGEEENIFKMFHENEVSYNPHYRVCIRNQFLYWRSFLENGSDAPFVHSLLPFPNGHLLKPMEYLEPNDMCFLASRFRFLQVLKLGLRRKYTIQFPKVITELVLLKCLMITCNLSSVPPSIRNLQNLEILILQCTDRESGQGIPYFPLAILEMQRLKHVSLTESCILLPDSKNLPNGFHDGIPPLENLKTFSCPRILLRFVKTSEMFLRKMPNVEKLNCAFGFDPRDNVILKFDFLSHLESLTMTGWAIPFWPSYDLHFPSTLKKLHLVEADLPWKEISGISKLPNLEVLKLDGRICGDSWNVGDEEFQNLKFLRLRNLKIKELNASENCFPQLEHFVVRSCEHLEEIPCTFRNIFTLKMIQVDFHLEKSARQIQEDQKDLGNELEVLVCSRSVPYWELFGSDLYPPEPIQ